MNPMQLLFAPSLSILLMVATSLGHAQTIQGVGSSFPTALYNQWATIYQKQTGVSVQYTSIGTTEGLNTIKKGKAAFAASNRPLKAEDLDAFDLLQFPVIMGGVTPIVNLANVGAGQLRLSNAVLLDIYSGKINRWTDPAIRRLNPETRLPAAPITVITRQDPSGTTYLLSHYFSRISPEWKAGPGTGTTIKFPVGFTAKGLEGLMTLFFRQPNSITYVDYAFARKHRLTYVQVQNKAGNFVAPNFSSIQAAARSASWTGAMSNVTTDAPHPSAWPIASPSYIVMRRQHADLDAAADAQHALVFFNWAYNQGDQIADDMDFVPLTSDVKAAVIRNVTDLLK